MNYPDDEILICKTCGEPFGERSPHSCRRTREQLIAHNRILKGVITDFTNTLTAMANCRSIGGRQNHMTDWASNLLGQIKETEERLKQQTDQRGE